jgi:N-formylglutamate amidohydrolase
MSHLSHLVRVELTHLKHVKRLARIAVEFQKTKEKGLGCLLEQLLQVCVKHLAR